LAQLETSLEDFARGWLTGTRRQTRLERRLSFARHVGAVFVALVVGVLLARPIVRVRSPEPLAPPSSDQTRFGLKLQDRRQIFADIAKNDAAARKEGQALFPNDPWSAQDHAASFERDTVRDVATRRKVSLSQAYLVLDEGIREGWPVPRGRPLDAHVVPLHPRRW
jgi:hypothetical protein